MTPCELKDNMIVQLVSFPISRLTLKEREYRIDTISRILNETDADFVMFSEHILKSKDDLFKIGENVRHKHITALFELDELKGLKGNKLYLLQNGKINNLETNQIFSTSEKATENNIEFLIEELVQHRQFDVAGKHFLVIQCGENNILKGNTGSADFRLQNRPDLKRRFFGILNGVDIVLNPVHSRWGRFGCFLCRMRKYSEKKRYSLSCTRIVDNNQLKLARKNPDHNVTHVVMHSKRRISPIYTNQVEDYLLQTYEIP